MSTADPPDRLTSSGVSYSGLPVSPYDQRQKYDYTVHEELPAIPSYHPDFALAESLVANAASSLRQPISSNNVQDVELQKIARGLQALRHVNFGKPMSVGVVGDTGMGKSSLMNSLLEHNLATEGDGGTSCTQIVTEYIFSDANDGPYRASIIFKDLETIRRDVKDHFEKLQKYRRPLRTDTVRPIQDEEEDDEAEEEGSRNEHIKTANEYLTQLFPSRQGFQSAAALNRMMGTLDANASKKRIAILQRAVEGMLAHETLGHAGTTKVFVNTDLRALSLATKQYTDTQPKRIQGLWPLVDKVQIFLSSALLAQGLRLADCPGMSDTNITRRQATQKYLEECDIIIVIAEISRILDSTAVQKYLDLYMPHVGSDRMLLLATKSEMIDHNPRNSAITLEQTQQLEALQEASEAAVQAEDDARREESSTNFDTAKQAAINAEIALKRARILVRKEAVISEARARHHMRYGDHARRLRIIPVSSKTHLDYTSGRAMRRSPWLNVDEDGIAEVRALLCAMAQQAYPDIIRRHIISSLRIQINKITMAIDRAPAQRIASVLDIVAEYSDHSTLRTDADMQKLRQIFDATVIPALNRQLTSPISMWMTKIKRKVAEWQDMLYSGQTFKAIASRNGVHKPSYVGYLMDLNQDIIVLINRSVTDIVQLLPPAMGGLKQEILNDGMARLDHLFNRLKTSEELRDFNMDAFYDNCRVHKANFSDSVDKGFDGFVATVHKIAVHEMGGDHSTAFNTAMHEMYNAARDPVNVSKTGGSVVMRRWQFVRDALLAQTQLSSYGATLPPSPLQALIAAAAEQVQNKMAEEHEELKRIMKAPFDGVCADLKIKFSATKDSEFVRSREREEIKAAVDAVLPGVEEMLTRALACIDEAEQAFAPVPDDFDDDEDMIEDGEFDDDGELGDMDLDDEEVEQMEGTKEGEDDGEWDDSFIKAEDDDDDSAIDL